MKRWFLVALFVLAASIAPSAHFVFVVPDVASGTALVVLSENLFPDEEVEVDMISGVTLSFRDASGRETPMPLKKGYKQLTSPLPKGAGLVHGMVDLGLNTRGEVPHILRYYPKTILGPAFSAATLGGDAPVELVPLRTDGELRLQFLVRGQPHADADVTVLFPGREQKVVKTDASGRTGPLGGRGMYGAWARYWEDAPGTRDGRSYKQIRHYATLVFDSTAGPQSSSAGASPVAARVTTLREPASSFGAVESGDWLYVYGGHIAPTHVYTSEAVSGRFSRFNLNDRKTWEDLPPGPPLQGMNLAAHGGKIYRVGGMQPQNRPGTPSDTQSSADVARFDPATKRWEPLPSLPAPRSSHDVVVVGDRLIVVGGWNLKGQAGTEWPDTMDVLDLSASRLEWTHIPEPFKRRALTAAALGRKVYVLGGFNERSQVVRAVSVYDVDRGTWSEGPTLPGEGIDGFGPAACVMDGRLFVSMGDGGLHRLNGAGTAWEHVGGSTPRIVHRLAGHRGQVLVLGGAAKGANFDLVEAIDVRK